MKILGIETSCDETAAAIVENGTRILTRTVASSQQIQQKYGGIVPEVAARKQVEYIIPVLTETLKSQESSVSPDQLDAIAVTVGPGLIGSLTVGVETAKILSYVWQKPCIPINHLVGHIYSAWLSNPTPTFPLIALIASGGHTDLVWMKDHNDFKRVGSTKDDAIGESFDKVARLLNLGYPGGPAIEKIAVQGNPTAYDFPRPLIHSADFDFSYSGLKTAVLYRVRDLKQPLTEQTVADLAASFQQAAFEPLVTKTLRAAQKYQAHSVLVTGGVAANRYLKALFADQLKLSQIDATLHVPAIELATDNAVYIASAGFFLFDQLQLNPQTDLHQILALAPNPNLAIG